MGAYPTLEEQAAAYLHSLARNHALVDGNKRLSWFVTVVFLDLNGREPALSDDKAFLLTMEVAKGDLEVPDIAVRLQVRPVSG
jgi:death on curing protein